MSGWCGRTMSARSEGARPSASVTTVAREAASVLATSEPVVPVATGPPESTTSIVVDPNRAVRGVTGDAPAGAVHVVVVEDLSAQ